MYLVYETKQYIWILNTSSSPIPLHMRPNLNQSLDMKASIFNAYSPQPEHPPQHCQRHAHSTVTNRTVIHAWLRQTWSRAFQLTRTSFIEIFNKKNTCSNVNKVNACSFRIHTGNTVIFSVHNRSVSKNSKYFTPHAKKKAKYTHGRLHLYTDFTDVTKLPVSLTLTVSPCRVYDTNS